MDKPLQQQFFRGLLVFSVFALVVLALYFVIPLIYPFLIAWFIAYLLNPLVRLLQRRAKFPRWAAVTFSLLLFLSISTGIVYFLINRLINEISYLSKIINTHIERWVNDIITFVNSDLLQNFIAQLNIFYQQNENYKNTLDNSINSFGDKVTGYISSFVHFVVNSVISFITSLPSLAVVMLVAILAAFFISKDWNKLIERAGRLFPDRIKNPSRKIWKDLQKALFGYLRAQLVMISLTACVVIIGLWIIGVDYAVTIGLFIGFIDLLPYLGTGAAMVPWIIYSFITGDVELGIGLSVLYAIIVVVRQLVEPKVLASSIGLNSLATLFALFIGLQLFGVLGLIIGPATMVILLAFQRAGVFRDLKNYIANGKKPEEEKEEDPNFIDEKEG